jgi:hypothetical protein
MAFPELWWATGGGGDNNKSAADNVSLSPLNASATITLTVVNLGGAGFSVPTLHYALNDGTTQTYSTGFAVSTSDSLKIGITPPYGTNGYGTILVKANETEISSIDYYWSPE